jgi:peptidoglycan hydrolase-like protein with peptidoglycan-binding domain
MTNPDVLQLQKYLNAQGFFVAQSGAGSIGKETNYFGLLTYKALIKFQEAHASDILTPTGLKKGTVAPNCSEISAISSSSVLTMILSKQPLSIAD